MSVIQSVLLEEINRLEKNVAHYKDMLSSLPKGSIYIRQMGKSFFVYRRKRENGKVISEYLGNKNNKEVQKQIQLSQEYKRINTNLKQSKIELIKLQKAYRIYDSLQRK